VRAPSNLATTGDVPGWVMVTIMTAGLLVVIFALFRDKITSAISDASDSVTGKTSSHRALRTHDASSAIADAVLRKLRIADGQTA
jgi:hypothetical protein